MTCGMCFCASRSLNAGSGMAAASDARLAQVRDDIAKRLRPINAEMPEKEFNDMIQRMAEIQLRFETRADHTESLRNR